MAEGLGSIIACSGKGACACWEELALAVGKGRYPWVFTHHFVCVMGHR